MIQLLNKREDHRLNYEDLVRNGKNLISKKDITDAVLIRDKIKFIESQWKELNNLLDEKHRLSKLSAERLSAYEKLRDQVIDWLNRVEIRVQSLEPVAIDLEQMKQQIEELKPVQTEYHDYSNTIDKINDIGIAYDNLIKERSDSSIRRRSGNNPIKRLNITSSCMNIILN
jgi:dystonin